MEKRDSFFSFNTLIITVMCVTVAALVACNKKPLDPEQPPVKEPGDTAQVTDPIDTTVNPVPVPTIKLLIGGTEFSDSVITMESVVSSLEVEVMTDTTWGVSIAAAPLWVSLSSDRATNIFTVNILEDNLSLQTRQVNIMIASGDMLRKITVVQKANGLGLSAIDSLALVEIYRALDGQYWDYGGKDVSWVLAQPVSTWQGVSTEIIDGIRRVTALNLGFRGLDGELPKELGSLTELRTLDIRENAIKGNIPTQIGELVNLETLMLDKNKFTGELPPTIAKLSKLKELLASDNRFRTFPVEICQAESLTVIHLEKNEIANLPGEITNLTKLEYLYLNENKLTALPAGLDKMPSLIYFHAQKNQIQALPENIGTLTNLTSLNLADNKIEGSIPASLVDLVNLKYLYLSNNSLSGSLPLGLEKMAALEVIEINDNALSGPLHNFGLNPAIQQVQLSGNALESDISTFFDGCPNLVWIMLGDNKLFGSVPAALAANKCPNLQYLALGNNNLTGTIPSGLGTMLNRYSPAFNQFGFQLYGNKLGGELPADLLTGLGYPVINKKYKYDTNLYPQQENFGFTNKI